MSHVIMAYALKQKEKKTGPPVLHRQRLLGCTDRVVSSSVRLRNAASVSADVDTTHGGADVSFANVLVDIGGPSRAEVAGRALEARILLALVAQMPRQRAAVGEGAAAGVGAEELLVRYLSPHPRVVVLHRKRGEPDAMGIRACNRGSIIDSAQSRDYAYARGGCFLRSIAITWSQN